VAAKRMLDPAMFTSEDYVALSIWARQLWIGMWGKVADDEGRGKAGARHLKAEVFPADTYATPARVEKWLQEIVARGSVRLYTHNGRRLFDIPSWNEHQRPKYVKKSKYPSFQEDGTIGEIPAKFSQNGEKPATSRDVVVVGLGSNRSSPPPAEDSPADTWHELVAWLMESWKKSEGETDNPNWAVGDFRGLKAKLKTLGEPELRDRWQRFLLDGFDGYAGHGLGQFTRNIDHWKKPKAGKHPVRSLGEGLKLRAQQLGIPLRELRDRLVGAHEQDILAELKRGGIEIA